MQSFFQGLQSAIYMDFEMFSQFEPIPASVFSFLPPGRAKKGEKHMFFLAFLLFLGSVIASLVRFADTISSVSDIARIASFVFVLFSVLSLLIGLLGPGHLFGGKDVPRVSANTTPLAFERPSVKTRDPLNSPRRGRKTRRNK